MTKEKIIKTVTDMIAARKEVIKQEMSVVGISFRSVHAEIESVVLRNLLKKISQ